MKTHQLIAYKNHIDVLGIGNYFSWTIEISPDGFELATIYGSHQGTFGTLRNALNHIDYKEK
jgi:hypothetical protein